MCECECEQLPGYMLVSPAMTWRLVHAAENSGDARDRLMFLANAFHDVSHRMRNIEDTEDIKTPSLSMYFYLK